MQSAIGLTSYPREKTLNGHRIPLENSTQRQGLQIKRVMRQSYGCRNLKVVGEHLLRGSDHQRYMNFGWKFLDTVGLFEGLAHLQARLVKFNTLAA
jgi:hypothetical protein